MCPSVLRTHHHPGVWPQCHLHTAPFYSALRVCFRFRPGNLCSIGPSPPSLPVRHARGCHRPDRVHHSVCCARQYARSVRCNVPGGHWNLYRNASSLGVVQHERSVETLVYTLSLLNTIFMLAQGHNQRAFATAFQIGFGNGTPMLPGTFITVPHP